MSVAQRISEAEYEHIVAANPDHQWELVDGRLREKPGMTWEHSDLVTWLAYLLLRQLNPSEFRVFAESRVRRPVATIFMPDVLVVPTEYGDEFRGRPGKLAIFSGPLPLVAEIWSQSTGDYDVDAKLPEYQRRGDLEIWRIHPYERTLTIWRRQPDGSYQQTIHRAGIVSLVSLPNVSIDLAELFRT
jgi:Uma2 family endonuclease